MVRLSILRAKSWKVERGHSPGPRTRGLPKASAYRVRHTRSARELLALVRRNLE
jgi:hypothetical protein